MSNEIKKARIRGESMSHLCINCLMDWDMCQCQPVTVGRNMTLKEVHERRMRMSRMKKEG